MRKDIHLPQVQNLVGIFLSFFFHFLNIIFQFITEIVKHMRETLGSVSMLPNIVDEISKEYQYELPDGQIIDVDDARLHRYQSDLIH